MDMVATVLDPERGRQPDALCSTSMNTARTILLTLLLPAAAFAGGLAIGVEYCLLDNPRQIDAMARGGAR